MPRKTDADIGTGNTALLTEIKERFDYATQQWDKIRIEARKDMRYIAGDVWDPKEREAREEANRPALSLDELGQYVNQLVNDVRANSRAMKFTPNGRGADDKSAEFYSNKAREIEYRSKAQIVYTTAFQNAVERSYGFFRVTTKWVPGKFAQELWLEPFVNPDLVTPDPDALSPTSADMRFCFVHETRDEKEFAAEFPKAEMKSFTLDARAELPAWFKGERVQIAEYWTIKKTRKRLLQLRPPVAPQAPGAPASGPAAPPAPIELYEDELVSNGFAPFKQLGSDVLLADRMEDVPSVCMYLTNGHEILKKTEWPGKYIPIVSCYGKVIWVDAGSGAERKMLSLIRLARDPAMLYSYYRTKQAEIAKLVPLAPVQAYEGQMRGHEDQWQKASDEPVGYLYFRGTTELTGANVLPPPSRLDYHAGEHLQALEMAAEGARRAIQAALGGSPLPTSAQRHNEKSGKALQRIEESSQKGSFHYIDHYNDMIEQGGVIAEDLMDKIYDTAREVGVRKPNDTAEMVKINQPGGVSTKGDHLVTVSTGPDYNSEREAASDFADTLAQIPQVFALIGDLVVKLKNLGPIGDEIAERLTPPQYRQQQTPDGKPPDPRQLAQQLAEAKGQLEQLKQVAQQMKQAIDTEQAKQTAQIKIKELDVASRERIADKDRAAKIEIARIGAAKQSADLALDAQEEALALGAEQAHEAQQAELDRAHDVGMAAQGQQHALDAGQQTAEQQAAASEQGHQQTLEQQQQAAAQQPPGAGE